MAGDLGGHSFLSLDKSFAVRNRAGNNGGGIYVGTGASATLEKGRLSHNHAVNDGAGAWNGGAISLVRSHIRRNAAGGTGGGVLNAVDAVFEQDQWSHVRTNLPDDTVFV